MRRFSVIFGDSWGVMEGFFRMDAKKTAPAACGEAPGRLR